jgi:hypothetical protein
MDAGRVDAKERILMTRTKKYSVLFFKEVLKQVWMVYNASEPGTATTAADLIPKFPNSAVSRPQSELTAALLFFLLGMSGFLVSIS